MSPTPSEGSSGTAALNRPRGEAVSARPRYLLDTAGKEAADRFAALSELSDPTTTLHLEQCGVCTGWHSLELGAGGGSVATWLADAMPSAVLWSALGPPAPPDRRRMT